MQIQAFYRIFRNFFLWRGEFPFSKREFPVALDKGQTNICRRGRSGWVNGVCCVAGCDLMILMHRQSQKLCIRRDLLTTEYSHGPRSCDLGWQNGDEELIWLTSAVAALDSTVSLICARWEAGREIDGPPRARLHGGGQWRWPWMTSMTFPYPVTILITSF